MRHEVTSRLQHRGVKIALIMVVTILVAVAATVLANRYTARPSATGERVTIQIKNDGFSPSVMTVTSGTTVTWVNLDDDSHGVASTPFPRYDDLPGLNSHQNIGTGDSYSYTFTKSGTYGFLDSAHPALSGKIIVK
jgi:plastocyanin